MAGFLPRKFFRVVDAKFEMNYLSRPRLLGDRVWLDSNANGRLDIGEEGVPGICVNLYDVQGKFLQRTTTDTNGYYGFNIDPGK